MGASQPERESSVVCSRRLLRPVRGGEERDMIVCKEFGGRLIIGLARSSESSGLRGRVGSDWPEGGGGGVKGVEDATDHGQSPVCSTNIVTHTRKRF